MHTYDKKARLTMGEEIRRQIGEVDAEIERLTAYKEEIQSAYDALAALEAVLRRMNMLARQAAKSGEHNRPGLLAEFEHCKELVEELKERAVVGGTSVLDMNLDDVTDFMERKPG